MVNLAVHRSAHRAAKKYTHPDTYPNAKQLKRSTEVLLFSVCILFLFTTFITFIVATAGSTANYSPIHNIYIGDADIKHINVTKVLPQIAPILTVLGTALSAPNSSLSEVFNSLKAIADTPALTPLLNLLKNAKNTSDSVVALTELAPLAISSDSSSSTKELIAISGLLSFSNNTNQTLESLGNLVMPTLAQLKSGQPSDNSTSIVLSILQGSDNKVASVDSLITLNNMTLAEKTKLLPVFQLFSYTTNINNTVDALGDLMNANVPTQLGVTLLTTIQSSLNGEADQDLSPLFDRIGGSVPEDNKQSVEAVEALLNDSSNKNGTINNLLSLLRQNVTTSPSAKAAFQAMSTLLDHSNNQTMVLQSLPILAAVRNTTLAQAQLEGLQGMLQVSTNPVQTLGIIAALQAGMADPNTNTDAVPALFNLLSASDNPANSFTSLVALTSWATSNPDTFRPIVSILEDANSVEPVTQEQLKAMTPALLDFLHVPVDFRLSIFTLCHVNGQGEITDCNSPHAVQNLDFRSIIYDALLDSDFQPYLKALNISKYDLYLEGKLLHRQHEYVPAVKAVLAMNILTIITSFFGIIGFILLMVPKYNRKLGLWIYTVVLTLSTALFSCLGAGIIAIMISIIKSGTSHDKFNVVFSTGGAYSGCVWAGFAVAFFACLIVLYCAFYARVGKPRGQPFGDEKGYDNDMSSMSNSSENNNYESEKVVQTVDVADVDEDDSSSPEQVNKQQPKDTDIIV